MKSLIEIAKEKLDSLNMEISQGMSLLPQLMLAVFNEETPDDLDLNMYDRNDMEQEIIHLLNRSDKAVWVMLGLNNPEREEDITRMLSEAVTIEQIREVMIMELLYEAMSENSDFFPNQLRISPAEKFRGEAFL
jgi:hypothetical protein